MSKLDAVKCKTSFYGNMLVMNVAIIPVIALWTASYYQQFPQWLLWMILVLIAILVFWVITLHKLVMSLLRNDSLWEE
ncbi:MAG: hypothetical protein GQ532_19865 [Methylomarinum sp.]|nr:hypothetical protein [Methylomarinum sp.]